jgi:hypothetical protein
MRHALRFREQIDMRHYDRGFYHNLDLVVSDCAESLQN